MTNYDILIVVLIVVLILALVTILRANGVETLVRI